MVRFRTFRNSDPPQLLQLIRQARTGRSFAAPDSVHALDTAVFSLPYFDPAGLKIVEDDGRIVGFAHGGFAFTEDLSRLDYSQGILCCALVSKAYQHQGIGEELLSRAEEYLLQAGARTFQAGQSRHKDPFYFGIYGGARPSGFLLSDGAADPFFRSQGYVPSQRIIIYQRDLREKKDPMNFRMMALKRQTELIVSDQPDEPTWWWLTHFGNIESMRFQLVERKSGSLIATLTVVGMDHYIAAWHERSIGLVDVLVEEKYRGQGYGQTLIMEAIRRLRTELITLAEIHVPEEARDATNAVLGTGFHQVDEGIVYSKSPPDAAG